MTDDPTVDSENMKRCKTCKHWDPMKVGERSVIPGTGGCTAARQIWDVTEPGSPDGDDLALLPEHAGLLCVVADGSHYKAEFITMPDFGCVMHAGAKA